MSFAMLEQVGEPVPPDKEEVERKKKEEEEAAAKAKRDQLKGWFMTKTGGSRDGNR